MKRRLVPTTSRRLRDAAARKNGTEAARAHVTKRDGRVRRGRVPPNRPVVFVLAKKAAITALAVAGPAIIYLVEITTPEDFGS